MAFNSSTLLTTAGVSTAFYCTDGIDKKNPEFNLEKFAPIAGTSVATTATYLAAATVNSHGINEIYNKYASTYVESMSDEELAEALQKMELLASDNIEENNTKKI